MRHWAGFAILLSLPLCFASTPAKPESTGSRWQTTLDRVATGVVSIRVDHTRAFDENWNQSTQASGFVVDSELGIILTNRHVVGPGPATATAVFMNQEEVDLVPIYRDPVHDFGFFRFAPDALRFMQPTALELAPGAASIGNEIRVVGNDAGEHLAILDGTIARLDRQAPDYGFGKYNDFNTYYFQAASGSSGGSSGSPVVNIAGEVVALNAGARNTAATSYFLPLYQAARTLQKIRKGQPIARGSLHTTFVARAYAELQKLGLTAAAESAFRAQFPANTNMLVVDRILPGSSKMLRVGDILISINATPVDSFATLARMLDTQISQHIHLCVQRAGEQLCDDTLVYDLADITPRTYLEFGGGVLHNLSYQRARHFNRPVNGVFLADPGFSFAQAGVPKDSLIIELAGHPINNIDDLQQVLASIPPGTQVNARYITLAANQTEKFARVRLDHTWFPARHCAPDRHEGLWQCTNLKLPAATAKASSDLPPSPPAKLQSTVADALVHVTFNMPFPVSGNNAGKRTGTGLIVDRTKGLVLTSRTTVAASLGNVYLTFQGALEVPARVIALHPAHNLALLAYTPSALGDLQVAQATLLPGDLKTGKHYTVVGLDNEHKVRRQRAALAEMEPVQFPLSNPPRFQNVNSNLLKFVNGPSDFTGVVLNDTQQVVALWHKFVHRSNNRNRNWYRGVPAARATDFLQRSHQQQPWYDLGAAWFPTSLAQVRKLGLPAAALDNITRQAHTQTTSLFELQRLTQGTAAARLLRTGDVLLEIDSQPAASLSDINRRTQQPTVRLKLLRAGKVLDLSVDTTALSLQGVQEVIFWAGALIQPPPRVLAVERQLPLKGVYVSFYKFGSPASRAGLVANLRVIEVDEQPISDINSFREAVKDRQHRKTIRLRVLDLNNQDQLLTLKTDKVYWPGYQLKRTGSHWQRESLN